MRARNIFVISLAGLIILAFAPAVAFGQNALGAGDALDHNLSPTSGGRNQAQRFENYRDRNLIITGDVVGGRGFRGAVGYTAPGDFNGRLGSNDLFGFRADSALSSPQIFGLGRTFDQLQYGQSLGVVEYRRAGSADPAAINAENPVAVSNAPSRVRLDRTTMALSTEFNLQSLAEPRVVGLMYNKDNQPLFFNASSVRGLTLEPMNQSVETIGLSTIDAARIRQDVEAGGTTPRLGAAFETPFDFSQLGLPKSGKQDGGANPNRNPSAAKPAPASGKNGQPTDRRIDDLTQSGRIDSSVQPDYGKIIQRVAQRYASRGQQADIEVSPEILAQLGKDYQSLRDQLTGNTTNNATDNQQGPTRPGARTTAGGANANRESPKATGRPSTGTPSNNNQGTQGATPGSTGAIPGATPDRNAEKPTGPQPPAEESGGAGALKRKPMTPEDFGVILRHGERIERFSNDSQDRFNELLSSAEQKLREGDYFLAERRFERALRFTPGHPLATAGAAHAQLGAGLHLSAAFSLRELLSSQPEMIDVTYAPDLLPKRDRLDAAVAAIQDRITEGHDRASYAFLLAYIGHQLGDQAMIQKGLDALSAAEPDSAFVKLLKTIWLAPADSKDAAPKAPAAPPTNPPKAESGK